MQRITFVNSNFHLHKERISSNIGARVLVNVVIMQCAPHFDCIYKIFSSIQLLFSKKLYHQSSFKLVKTSFISPASIYATSFIKVGRKFRGEKVLGESPKLVYTIYIAVQTQQKCSNIPSFLQSYKFFNDALIINLKFWRY